MEGCLLVWTLEEEYFSSHRGSPLGQRSSGSNLPTPQKGERDPEGLQGTQNGHNCSFRIYYYSKIWVKTILGYLSSDKILVTWMDLLGELPRGESVPEQRRQKIWQQLGHMKHSTEQQL